ncbi:hypothetical protein, partial [Stappia sp. TSB10P1A]|uniref:hypothetical protein n=1 Tax=Stappia sp. TSB10P1A TaxID=2003585 RepID=UPI00164383CE
FAIAMIAPAPVAAGGVEVILERHEVGPVADRIIMKMVNNTGKTLVNPVLRCVLLDGEGRAMDIVTAYYDDIADGEAGYEKLFTTVRNVHRFSCKSGTLRPPAKGTKK